MQKRSTHTHLSLSFIVQGLGWLGGLSLLGSGFVFAKGPYNPDLPIQENVPDYSPNPVDSAPSYAPEPVAPSQTYAPEPTPVYQEPARGYQDNSYSAPVEAPWDKTPEPASAPESHQGVSPDAVFESRPQREAIAPPEPLNRPQLDRPNVSPQHSYIDDTDYSLGATSAQDSQVVVFEERSTGCEARVSGRVSGQLCRPSPSQSQPSPGHPLPQTPVASGGSSQAPGSGQSAAAYRPGAASGPSGFSISSQSAGGAQVPSYSPSLDVDYAQMRARLLRDMAVQPLERSFRAPAIAVSSSLCPFQLPLVPSLVGDIIPSPGCVASMPEPTSQPPQEPQS